MRRVLSVYLPLWPVERIARRLGRRERRLPVPVLLVETKAQRQLVAHACAPSLRAGVRPGMSLAHARALLNTNSPVVANHEPHKDAAGLVALARWAIRWSPVVSADPPDGLLIDITGCAHLFGGERALVDALRAALQRLRLTARCVVASTVGAAWGVARFGPRPCAIIEDGRECDALDTLTVHALRLDHVAVAGLAEIGVMRVGQLLALPRTHLPARYGAQVIRRIDQALGQEAERIARTMEAPDFRAALELPGGTTQHEAITSATRLVLADLARQLEQYESGLRQLDAHFARLDAQTLTITVQVSRPTRSAKHLWRLLAPKVERLHLGYGVEGIELTALRVTRIAHTQTTLIDDRANDRHDEQAFAQMLDTIASRIGHDRLCRAVLRESHRPERAAVMMPLHAPQPEARPADVPVTFADRPRPSRLFETPEPANGIALSPDGPVMMLAWRGRDHRIIQSIGPERVSGEWWRSREGGRDYFRVQDEGGRWLWAFRDGRTGAWFIHGEWA